MRDFHGGDAVAYFTKTKTGWRAQIERKGVRMDRMDDRYYAARFEGGATLLD